MRYDLYSLKLFTKIAGLGSIARAAEAENIAASAISKRISDLEHHAGCPLLQRQPRGVTLTPAGEEFLRLAVAIISGVDELDEAMARFSQAWRGQVRVAANTSAITQFLPEDLAHFVEKFPDIKIELKELTSYQIVTAVRDGAADIGIYSGHYPVDNLEVRDYRTDTLVAFAPVNHPLASAETTRLEELAQYDMVGLQVGSSLQAFLDAEAVRQGLSLTNRVEVMSFDGVRRMVEAGLGVGILPLGAVAPFVDSAGLAQIPLVEAWANRTLKIATRETIPRAAQALLDSLAGKEKHFGEAIPASLPQRSAKL
ncbi:MAG: LysR family transcriptional regulator [Geminicoccales bacterium]